MFLFLPFQYEEALDIVEQSSTPLSETLSDRLAAPAGTSGREALLRRLADVLGTRGLYHQAAKRLAHAGDKVCYYAVHSALDIVQSSSLLSKTLSIRREDIFDVNSVTLASRVCHRIHVKNR